MEKATATTFNCDQPGCTATYAGKHSLGVHKRFAHGITGTSPTAKHARVKPRKRKRGHGFECDQPGCTAAFKRPQELGRHKQAAHGIAGTSAASVSKQKRQSRLLVDDNKGENTQHAIVKTSGNATAQQHGQDAAAPVHSRQKRFVEQGIEAAVAVAFGRVTELCRSIADQYDLPSRMFTSRVAELLHTATIR